MPEANMPADVAKGYPRSERAAADGAGEPEALSVTHWFDSGNDGEPYSATIRFKGRRVGIRGKPTLRDAFMKEETVAGIVPGSGPVSITTWVYDLQPGDWTVTADLIRRRANAAGLRLPDNLKRMGAQPLPRAAWSWRRWALSNGAFTPVKTRWAPLVRLAKMPGVVRGSWSGLIAVGVIVGAAVQAGLLARQHVSVGQSLIVDLLALLSGLIGAKLWYAAFHPRSWRRSIAEGMSVDGFLLVTPAVAAAALLGFKLPIGLFLDASAPALFFGVAIGRLGCFFTGCCAGRCTRSGWGVWSSDRRVGARRIPTQLLESAASLVIGAAAVLLVLRYTPSVRGAIFVAAFAAYVLVRQFLLRLRAEPHNPIRARVTAAAAALVLLTAATALLMPAS